MQVLAVQLGAVSKTGGDAVSQEALYSPPVERCQNGWWEVGTPQPSQDQPLKALHDGRGERYGAVVVEAGHR